MDRVKKTKAPETERATSRRAFLGVSLKTGAGVAALASAGCAHLATGDDGITGEEERYLAEIEELASESNFRPGQPTISMRTAELREYVASVESCSAASARSFDSEKSRRVLRVQRETLRNLTDWQEERIEVNARVTSIFACKPKPQTRRTCCNCS